MENKIGPNIEPCGTPHTISARWDIHPQLTLQMSYKKKDTKQFNGITEILTCVFNVLIKIVCQLFQRMQ